MLQTGRGQPCGDQEGVFTLEKGVVASRLEEDGLTAAASDAALLAAAAVLLTAASPGVNPVDASADLAAERQRKASSCVFSLGCSGWGNTHLWLASEGLVGADST